MESISKNQTQLLWEVYKQDGRKGATQVGRRVYLTNISIYHNLEILRDMGLIYLKRVKNKIIPMITMQGEECLMICKFEKKTNGSNTTIQKERDI
jgi:hypothetical protein